MSAAGTKSAAQIKATTRPTKMQRQTMPTQAMPSPDVDMQEKLDSDGFQT